MWLSDAQLRQYTRRQKPSAQRRVLDDAGIPYRMVDGRPVVLISDACHQRKKESVRLNL